MSERDKLIAAMAHAIHETENNGYFFSSIRCARAALDAIEAAGWRIVPPPLIDERTDYSGTA